MEQFRITEMLKGMHLQEQNPSIHKILNIYGVRTKITSYLLGWEISNLIAATRIGWEKIDKKRCKDIVRNVFGAEVPFSTKTLLNSRITVLGTGLEEIRRRIYDFSVRRHKSKKQRTIIIYFVYTAVVDLFSTTVNYQHLMRVGHPRYESRSPPCNISQIIECKDLLDTTIEFKPLIDVPSTPFFHTITVSPTNTLSILNSTTDVPFIDSITINEKEVFEYKIHAEPRGARWNASNNKEMLSSRLLLVLQSSDFDRRAEMLQHFRLVRGVYNTFAYLPMYKYWSDEE